MARKVVFLGTGGTIAGQSGDRSDNVDYLAAQVGIEQLLKGVPALSLALQGIFPDCEQVVQVDQLVL